jgi:hypothetical protein
MSQEQLEKKVTDYLRKSQALEDYWQRPITTEQLQAEMDRMANYSKQPDVLCELFQALRNDPFIIAECLARPALADRLLTTWYYYDQTIHGELKHRAETNLEANPAVDQLKQLSGNYHEIEFVRSNSGEAVGRAGRLPTEELASEERAFQPNDSGRIMKLSSRHWGETMQKLAGVFNRDKEPMPLRKLSSLREEETRYYAVAILNKTSDHLKFATVSWPKQPLEYWLTSSENRVLTPSPPRPQYMLPRILGGRCTDDTWAATNAEPLGRFNHSAVWTGTEMIIWGGDATSGLSNSGSRYLPGTDTWTPTSIIDAPAGRDSHTAVWTGTEMIVWGGYDGGHPNTGGRYNPDADTWTATSTTNAPEGRESHSAVWTGAEMIVWGGFGDSGLANTGGKYNPNTDSWSATSMINAPSSREHHTAVWTGSNMIIWGGYIGTDDVNDGGRYDPNTNSWTVTSTTNAPEGRESHTAVWTGTEMIVWGGAVDYPEPANGGGRYCAQSGPPPSPTPTATASPSATATPTPTATSTATATGTPTVSPTPTGTPTTTVTPSSTPRITPTPRAHPSPKTRPTAPPHLTPVPTPSSPRPTAWPRPTSPPHITPVPPPSSPRPTPAPRP